MRLNLTSKDEIHDSTLYINAFAAKCAKANK